MAVTFGSHIKEGRIIKNLSKSELARRVGITPQYITDIETDRIIPNEDKIARFVDVLDLDEKSAYQLANKLPVRVFEQAKKEYFDKE